MRILLINPPYRAMTIHGMGPQVPLGLLAIAGPMIDAGHDVQLLNAEQPMLGNAEIVQRVRAFRPDVIMTGHSGSTPAHPTVLRMLAAIKAAMRQVVSVYGGVYPSYHARRILESSRQVDVIVRGEGEQVAVQLAAALAAGETLATIAGIAYRSPDGSIVETPPAPVIRDLNACRVAWELIDDWDAHQCWGLGRSAIIQFSRGCPHRCSYCGQRDFWVRWRHRDPGRVAQEIALLHRRHGVRFVTFADENPTTSSKHWQRFLEEMAAQSVPVALTAAMRASDICRDADLLPLYKRAGFCAVLIGIETTEATTIERVGKGSNRDVDREAIRLLRRNGIIAIAAHVAGLEDEGWGSRWRAFRGLLRYDPDLVNVMYATPHDWTRFGAETTHIERVEPDMGRWDFRHQVLATTRLRAWQLFVAIKVSELALHTRPRFLWRMAFHPDAAIRRQLRWCFRNAAKVWLAEITDFRFTGAKRDCVPLGSLAARLRIEKSTTKQATARQEGRLGTGP
ncbi:MAG: cobalamin-dependent protein [Rhodocyclaceae bacterium]|nr:cobalamin-dependent protein [Rhodocyclaceae bacterium]